MTRDFYTLQVTDKAIKARELLLTQGGGLIIITDETGKMRGILSLSDLPKDIFEDRVAEELTVEEILRQPPSVIKASDALQNALTKLEQSGEEILPVVSPEGKDIVVGLIKHREVMREYNRALLESHGQDKTVGRHG